MIKTNPLVYPARAWKHTHLAGKDENVNLVTKCDQKKPAIRLPIFPSLGGDEIIISKVIMINQDITLES